MHVLNDLLKCNTCHMVYHPNSPVRSKLGGIVSSFEKKGNEQLHLLLRCTFGLYFGLALQEL